MLVLVDAPQPFVSRGSRLNLHRYSRLLSTQYHGLVLLTRRATFRSSGSISSSLNLSISWTQSCFDSVMAISTESMEGLRILATQVGYSPDLRVEASLASASACLLSD
ncbi:hypothetical protein BHM03_00017842 [Ensete ventricosum]|nr:hypothetical protein BHM03_00017842 [Ensete ventricosum]